MGAKIEVAAKPVKRTLPSNLEEEESEGTEELATKDEAGKPMVGLAPLA